MFLIVMGVVLGGAFAGLKQVDTPVLGIGTTLNTGKQDAFLLSANRDDRYLMSQCRRLGGRTLCSNGSSPAS